MTDYTRRPSIANFALALSCSGLLLGLSGCNGDGGSTDAGPATQPDQTQADSPEEVQQARVAQPPASPPSSADMPTRPQGPPHDRPIKREDGRTLLWAGVDRETGETIWFDMTGADVDPAKFQYGIGKDRIPSIDEPAFARVGDPALAAARIGDETDVIGYVHDGVAKAYPLFILDRHEIVNDTFGGDPLAVYW